MADRKKDLLVQVESILYTKNMNHPRLSIVVEDVFFSPSTDIVSVFMLNHIYLPFAPD